MYLVVGAANNEEWAGATPIRMCFDVITGVQLLATPPPPQGATPMVTSGLLGGEQWWAQNRHDCVLAKWPTGMAPSPGPGFTLYR